MCGYAYATMYLYKLTWPDLTWLIAIGHFRFDFWCSFGVYPVYTQATNWPKRRCPIGAKGLLLVPNFLTYNSDH
jgi:hypothetical protein